MRKGTFGFQITLDDEPIIKAKTNKVKDLDEFFNIVKQKLGVDKNTMGKK